MTNAELVTKLDLLVRSERRITDEILQLIREADRRQLHLELGYPNLYDWLEKGFGYSRGAAARRIQAARLLEAVPEARAKLEEGALNLSTLAQVQSAVRKAERECGKSLPLREELVRKVEGKSTDDVRKILAAEFPEQKPRETLRVFSEEEARLTIVLGEDGVENLKRAKELLSHALPDASYADIVAYALKMLVDKKAPEKKSAADTRSVKKQALRRAAGRCEFKNEKTDTICGSRHQVEVDHVVPKALGGTDDPANLRCLCKQHNLFEAERKLGKEFMGQFRMRP
ncbi:MAG: HNH endonuclease [Bdellovibrionota bacterium]